MNWMELQHMSKPALVSRIKSFVSHFVLNNESNKSLISFCSQMVRKCLWSSGLLKSLALCSQEIHIPQAYNKSTDWTRLYIRFWVNSNTRTFISSLTTSVLETLKNLKHRRTDSRSELVKRTHKVKPDQMQLKLHAVELFVIFINLFSKNNSSSIFKIPNVPGQVDMVQYIDTKDLRDTWPS